MKYIKNFESVEYDIEFDNFSIFIRDFINEKLNNIISLKKDKTNNSFWYFDNNHRNHLFYLYKIDHYSDDLYMFFEIDNINEKMYNVPKKLVDVKYNL